MIACLAVNDTIKVAMIRWRVSSGCSLMETAEQSVKRDRSPCPDSWTGIQN